VVDVKRPRGLNRNRHGKLRGPTDEDAAKMRGFVYFMQREDESKLIKIGFSLNPRARQQSLSREIFCPVHIIGIEIGTMLKERQLHLRFEEHSVQGEWFEANADLLSYIDHSITGQDFSRLLET
jgi:Meiotically up-regulated gene 113